jgi:hypothetical protein
MDIVGVKMPSGRLGGSFCADAENRAPLKATMDNSAAM